MSGGSTFRYLRDPCCVAATALYLLQRLLLVGVTGLPAWWRGHATDLLFLPAGVPVWLWIERRLGWRVDDRMPTWQEVLLALTVWTFSAEVLAPALFRTSTADGWDAVAYGTGALVATITWRYTA